MKNKKYLFMFLFLALFLILFCKPSYAGSQKMKKLEYEANLNEDGSMDIIEIWNIKVTDTNTLFKTFDIDSNKYAGITNVSVEEVLEGNETTKFTQIYKEMYHVTKGCFYALKNSKGDFEIAWGVSIDGTKTKTYKVKYKILDAVKVYNDCSELYWQFLSTDNGIPVDKVIGTITLPKRIEKMDNLRVWAHGPLDGVIERASNNKVTFEVEDLSKNTMLEVRVVTEENIFTESTNTTLANKLDKIIEEEAKWADEANAERTRAKVFVYVMDSLIFLSAIWFLTRTVKTIKKIKSVKKLKPETEYEYFREIPDKNATPADAAFLYYFESGGIKQNISKIFSATLLDLCLKKMLTFEMGKEEKAENVKIVLTQGNDEIVLEKNEQIIYDELKKIENGTFTIKQLQKYIKNHSEKFVKALEKIEEVTEEEQIKKENFDESIAKKGRDYGVISCMYVFMLFVIVCSIGIILGIYGIIIYIIFIINAILSGILASRYKGITQKGVNEKEKWKGLKKYMQDFSLIKEREVPELVLWEKYLVFATVFGIADKVIKQLKVVYPQIEQDELIGDYAYMHIMVHSNLNLSFISSLNSAITSSYRTAYNSTYSSGSGSGGGFSGGGGGRRWRRPEWAEDSLQILLIACKKIRNIV